MWLLIGAREAHLEEVDTSALERFDRLAGLAIIDVAAVLRDVCCSLP